MKKVFKSKKSAVIAIISLLIIVTVLVNVMSSFVFSFSIFRKDGAESFEEYSYGEKLKSDSDWISEKGKKIEFENSEGKTINAFEIKNEHVSHSYIIICHQYSGGPETMTEYAKHFYKLGFNIILPYMRGHGDSEYNYISLGWDDRLDVADLVTGIIEKDEKARIALFGVSLGANAVTLAAAEDLPENVRLVISDSCYTSLNDLMKEYIKNETSLSSLIVKELLSVLAEEKIGGRLKDADTIVKVRDIELPIMFINGENDEVVPPLVSKRLYENCEAEGVEEVIIEEGTHGRNLQADKETYWAYIDGFILNNIGI